MRANRKNRDGRLVSRKRGGKEKDPNSAQGGPGIQDIDGGPRNVLCPRRLVRSMVYRKVPVAVRSRLDKVILLRPAGLTTIEAIAEHFRLAGRYGISLASLRSYARKLEAFVRPIITAQLAAGILGCLPSTYRHQILAGSQVLLLSRVIQALSADDEQHALSVSDLARLASLLKALAGRHVSLGVGRKLSPPDHPRRCGDPSPRNEKARSGLAEAVHALYGLTWPPADPNSQQGGGQAGASQQHGLSD